MSLAKYVARYQCRISKALAYLLNNATALVNTYLQHNQKKNCRGATFSVEHRLDTNPKIDMLGGATTRLEMFDVCSSKTIASTRPAKVRGEGVDILMNATAWLQVAGEKREYSGGTF